MSGATGNLRKVLDIGPASLTSNNNYDGSSSPTTVWASGILQPSSDISLWLTDCAQGTTDNDRIGYTIACDSLDLSLVINPDITVTGHAVLRWLIVADNECDGAYPTPAEVLGNSQQSDTTIATGYVQSHLQPGYFGRFEVLMDETFEWFTDTIATGININFPTVKGLVHRRHFDLKGHRVAWDMGDASAITDARRGHIFMFGFFQNNSVATGGLNTQNSTNPPNIQFNSRIRYKDV